MADKASLITELQTALKDSPGVDDDMLAIATAIGDAIDKYSKTLKATGTAGSDQLPIA
jgi:hypothetical protein